MNQPDTAEKTQHTRAITHIPLNHINPGKLAQMDELAEVYMALCQQYVIYFCTEAKPYAHQPFVFDTVLSDRWQRVAVQQAAGIAKSWRANRNQAYAEYRDKLARFEAKYPTLESRAGKQAPQWREFNLPTLRQVCIQANANVVQRFAEDKLPMAAQPAEATEFDFWLRFSTLTPRQTIFLPIKLAEYHREAIGKHAVNQSVQLNRREDNSWWLTVSISDPWEEPEPADQSVAVDVGIRNFVTSSTGKRYGSFDDKLIQRHQRDRAKRQRKAKLRACLKKKGVEKLPSTSSASGQRLSRHVKQSINRAVNQFFNDHPDHDIVLEKLSVSAMRFKSRRMNAYLYASQLGHIPDQIKWVAEKRKQLIVTVNPAYSSQECPVCHFVDRKNRPMI